MTKNVSNKIIVYYFAGTGNAKNSALWIKDEVEKIGREVEIFDIAKIDITAIPIPEEGTIVGFISPTHGFHFPEIM